MTVPLGELRIQVVDDEVINSLPDSRYAVTYYKPANSEQLLARKIPMEDDPRPQACLVGGQRQGTRFRLDSISTS
jgi:hypothetical protein